MFNQKWLSLFQENLARVGGYSKVFVQTRTINVYVRQHKHSLNVKSETGMQDLASHLHNSLTFGKQVTQLS